MAKTYQDIQNELGVNEENSIVELIAKMNDYNVVSPSEITKIISVSVDRLENQVTGKAKEVKRRMYEPVTDDTKGIVSVLNKRIVLLDMIINKLKLEALDILNQHRTNYSNPHNVTKTQVGLNNVDNTSDLDKPISNATQTALNEISSDLDTHKNNTSNPHNVTKAQVGLSNVLDKEQLGKQEKAVDSDKLNGQKADYYAVKENIENEAAYDLDFSMDSSNYVLTVYLKNKSGVVLTQKSIDLPLETMVIGGRYDNETKKIILTLRGVDKPIEFSVADLISGLQGEITENNKLRVELIDGLTKTYLGLENVINKGMDDKPTLNSDNYVKSGGVYNELNKKIDKSQGSSNANKVFMTDSSGNLILKDTIPSNSLPSTGVSVDAAKKLEKTDGTYIEADEVALKKDVSEVDIDVEGTGSIVSIPENATGYGTIEKLGGKTSVNVATLSNKTYSSDGVTLSINNGIITLNGTASTNISFHIKISNFNVKTTDYCSIKSLSGTVNKGDSYGLIIEGFIGSVNLDYRAFNPNFENGINQVTKNGLITNVVIYCSSGATFNNYQCYLYVGENNFETPSGLTISIPQNVKVVGRNLWDEQWEEGTVDTSNGSNVNYSGPIRSKNYISVLPNTSYYYYTSSSSLYWNIVYYDKNKNFLSAVTWNNITANKAHITPNNCYYMRFNTSGGYGSIYNHDIAIIEGTSGTYSPYTEQNLPQTSIINYVSTQLQTNHSWTQENASKWLGLGVGNDSNNINYANKKGIVKYGIVDLGTLDYSYNSEYNFFYSNELENYKYSMDINALCSKYDFVSAVNSALEFGDASDKTFTFYINNYNPVKRLYIKDSNYTNATTDFKNAMSGVMLIYELATPIEIDLSSLETEEHFECEPNGTIYHDSLANYKYSFPVSLKGQVELNFEHDKEQQRDIDNLKKEIDLNTSELNSHKNNMSNPHNVTKEQLELENVGNFKAVSTVANQGLTEDEKLNARKNINTYSTDEINQNIDTINQNIDTINQNIESFVMPAVKNISFDAEGYSSTWNSKTNYYRKGEEIKYLQTDGNYNKEIKVLPVNSYKSVSEAKIEYISGDNNYISYGLKSISDSSLTFVPTNISNEAIYAESGYTPRTTTFRITIRDTYGNYLTKDFTIKYYTH